MPYPIEKVISKIGDECGRKPHVLVGIYMEQNRGGIAD